MRVFVLICIGLVISFALAGCDKKIKEAGASEVEDVARAMEQVEEVEIIESSRGLEEDVTVWGFVVDENQPLFEIRAEAEAMDDVSLAAAAKSYKDLISVKQVELIDLTGQLDEMPFTDPFGRTTFTSEADIGELTESISALSERHGIYLNVLDNRGLDTSGLGLD
jgi:hypothetical protein